MSEKESKWMVLSQLVNTAGAVFCTAVAAVEYIQYNAHATALAQRMYSGEEHITPDLMNKCDELLNQVPAGDLYQSAVVAAGFIGIAALGYTKKIWKSTPKQEQASS